MAANKFSELTFVDNINKPTADTNFYPFFKKYSIRRISLTIRILYFYTFAEEQYKQVKLFFQALPSSNDIENICIEFLRGLN